MHLKFKNIVYTPIPKVACTTIKAEYIRLIEEKRRKKGKFPFSKVIDTDEVHKFFERVKSFHVSEQMIIDEGFFHFIFIRDPYDRLVSGYLSKIRNSKRLDGTPYFEPGGVAKKLLALDSRLKGGVTFPRFMEYILENHLIRENLHFRPQCLFLSERGWDNVDFIGRMENFNEDWKSMCNQSGLPHTELMKSNVSQTDKRYRDFFNKRTRRIAEEIYGDDIEKFGCKF